jgi:hypothetical protein
VPKSRHGLAKKPLLRIPTEGDWGDYRYDLDQTWAHDQFGDRSNEEMQPYIRGTPIGAAEDLHFMPEVPFRYYVLGYRDYIMAGQFGSPYASDAASCFIRLVLRKLQEQPRYIVPIMPELLPAVEHVAHNQAAFDADESIYGNFLEMLKQIQALYAEARDRYRRL